ncbi:MAG: hypothetical protein DWQ07_21520 [Chloroflexi bacterium]|nr:MAG: hypothetical protein DWQ07_21520 [Chloroflexota bacterium]MBL1196598.1 hypothetical protein [Chloroflexota bacterium]NOH13893.1 hypothetical protein [Chloroflexota bacterium]
MGTESKRIQINSYFPYYWVVISTVANILALAAVHFLFESKAENYEWSGTIAFLSLGVGQWFLLRKYLSGAGWWIVATFFGGVASYASVYGMSEVFEMIPGFLTGVSSEPWFEQIVDVVGGIQYIDIAIYIIFYASLLVRLLTIYVGQSFWLAFPQWLYLRRRVVGAWKWLVVIPIVTIVMGLFASFMTGAYFRYSPESYPEFQERIDTLWFRLLFASLFQIPLLLITGFVMRNLLGRPKQKIEETESL